MSLWPRPLYPGGWSTQSAPPTPALCRTSSTLGRGAMFGGLPLTTDTDAMLCEDVKLWLPWLPVFLDGDLTLCVCELSHDLAPPSSDCLPVILRLFINQLVTRHCWFVPSLLLFPPRVLHCEMSSGWHSSSF